MVDQIDAFRTFKNKSVATAARGFINLVKEINPSLLSIYDKDLPKNNNAYGQSNINQTIDGIDLYKRYEKMPEGNFVKSSHKLCIRL